jgi:hypothetical protein
VLGGEIRSCGPRGGARTHTLPFVLIRACIRGTRSAGYRQVSKDFDLCHDGFTYFGNGFQVRLKRFFLNQKPRLVESEWCQRQ